MRTRPLAFVLASIVAATSLSVACGGSSLGSPDDPAELAEGFTTPPSLDPATLFRDLAFDRSFDGVVMRRVGTSRALSASDAGPPEACSAKSPDPSILSDIVLGDPCGRAPDATKCKDALACIASQEGWNATTGNAPREYVFFVFGKGGELTRVATRPELDLRRSMAAPVRRARRGRGA